VVKKGFWAKLALVLVTVLFVNGTLSGLIGGLASASNGLKNGVIFSTSPIQPLGIFNPSHLYLFNGNSTITASTGSLSISGDTSATQVVDSIGITFYVQKWNGSSWEAVGSGSAKSGSNASYYTNAISKSVTAGYYYRVRTIHWVIENGVYEEGEKFSSSILGI
jgi:hypothetical protein